MKHGKNRNFFLLSPIFYLTKRITEDPVPFLFFGFLIGLKIYHFMSKLEFVTDFVSIMYGIDQSFHGLKTIFFSRPILDLIYTIAAVLFDAIIIFSYLIRLKPAGEGGKAQGFRERWYPIITVLFPMIAFTYLLYRPIPLESDPLFHNLYHSQSFIHIVGLAGLVFSLVGCMLSIMALLKLRGSFSLMVEVRRLVRTGMYKYIRHPLYFSELTHALGTTLLLLNSVTIPIYIIFFIMEVIRAKFEERKFLETLPEYDAYRAETGFFFPKFRTLLGKQQVSQNSYQT